jgi:drug/metabolite transporter (DMT)-like permease
MSNGGAVPSKTTDRERWAGTIFAFLSTFLYGVSNVAIRYLTECEVDYDSILFYKESIGLLLLTPWLLFRWGQGRFQYSSKRLAFYIFIAAILCQLIGARLQVLGYAVIGLIIAVPLIQSSVLFGVAILGYYIFGDPLSRRRKIAIAILIVAVVILSVGKELTITEPSPEKETVSAGLFLLVAAGSIVTGIAYAIYVTILRYVIRQYWKDENSAWLSFKFRHWIGHDHTKQPGQRFYSPFPVTLTMSIVLSVGIVIFGTFLYCKHGVAGFSNVPQVAWYGLLVSGVANMVGFFFQIQGLRLTSAVQASLIAISQMLILSLIGYLFFHEAVNVLVMVGLGLTVYGVFMSAKPEK